MKRILITPLNWGLGHATRCMPVIDYLLQRQCEVLIASDGNALQFLKREYPSVEFFELPGYNITYPEGNKMAFKMMLQLPLLIKAVSEEHKTIEALFEKKKFDAIISDNRYGCFHKNAYSVFITHQLNIQTPPHLNWFKPVVKKINLNRIANYNECWIPDFAGDVNLSGNLSHGTDEANNLFFAGPLSRFYNRIKFNAYESTEPKHTALLCLISGPEPQRSVFEKMILEQSKHLKVKTDIVCGRAGEYNQYMLNDFVKVHASLNSDAVFELMNEASIVICRSGYTTIMELAATGKKAVLIPTPGQTEQEYLAKKFFVEKVFYKQNQNEFDLQKALLQVQHFSGIKMENDFAVMKNRIDFLLSR